ncbi:MAG: hypothetical protein COX46_05410, partial [bacterium (Candidatus Ratteibacteria) CG23_combo_of_CG06-09_8_20_14_all_48_7]
SSCGSLERGGIFSPLKYSIAESHLNKSYMGILSTSFLSIVLSTLSLFVIRFTPLRFYFFPVLGYIIILHLELMQKEGN